MKRYPIGIQDFGKIRREGYVYVDKTEQIHRLLEQGSYYFLARPRRFGKSLLLSTLKELYSGNAALFEDLWIAKHWDFAARRRPVIWLRLARLDYKNLGLSAALHAEIKQLAARFEVTLRGLSMVSDFGELIEAVGRKQRVVLLIDEYDKPVIDYLEEPAKLAENQAVLKSFYSVLKDNDPYLELIFITGVAAFTKVSIFSDLNHISNITLNPLSYTLLGITQRELEHYFAEELAEEDPDKVRQWYNGYSWGGDERVYNPFSLLGFLRSRVYENFWFESGTPTFLVNRLRHEKLYRLEQRDAPRSTLVSFHLPRPDIDSLLFQTGYLTVVARDPHIQQRYTLNYPNREVRQSFDQLLLAAYLDGTESTAMTKVYGLLDAFRQNDTAHIITVLNSTFAELPYEFWQRDDEHFFHAVIHLLFNLVGVHIRSEVHAFRGRCDAIVETDTHVYAFEFKRNASARAALDQIAERGYLTPFAQDGRERLAVGINFDTAQRQIEDWRVTTLPKA